MKNGGRIYLRNVGIHLHCATNEKSQYFKRDKIEMRKAYQHFSCVTKSDDLVNVAVGCDTNTKTEL
jgi:hypothetical protein